MLEQWITYTLNNFGLVMFLLAVIIVLIDWPIQKFRRRASFFEILYRWVAFLPLGITSIYACIMHAVFPSIAAATIGWQLSPFQFEVAMANLGFGMIAFLSFNANYSFRTAVVIANTFWLWGDAVGHIYQMIMHHNFAVGNAGSWFWMDILIPLILILCMLRMKPQAEQPITT